MLMNKILLIVGLSLVVFGLSGTALGQQSVPTSPNYNLPESYVGPGGSLDSSSTNYRSSDTAGDIGVGNSASTNFNAQSGFNTTNDPRLVLVVNTSSVSFGALSTSVAKTATSTFSVLNYTAHGYGVYTIGAPPSNGAHSLEGITSTGPSQVGVEQYGINLVANTSPVTFGAIPVQTPSGSFSFGAASSGYNTANNFRYVPGEQIAAASQSSGQTDYTISYIVNAATNTPGGQYGGSQSLVVVGTY